MHSQSLQNLKLVKERLGNYSSSHLMATYDYMIYSAIEPLILNTNFIDAYVASLINWIAEGRNRKIARCDVTYLLLVLTLFLAEKSRKKKFKLIRKACLERSILHYIISDFLELGKSYFEVRIELSKSEDILQKSILLEKCHSLEYLAKCDGNLWSAYLSCSFWHSIYIDFKNQVIEKYLRFIVNKANSYNKNKERLDLDDVVQNFSLSISKAIDRFDPRKGTLTSYIELWVRNAESYSSDSHEYGIAFTLPFRKKQEVATDKKNVNIYTSFEDQEVQKTSSSEDIENDIEKLDQITLVRYLAKYADPSGIARSELGVQEILSIEELFLLKKCCLI